MLTRFSPRFTHQVQNLEELLEMVILLDTNYIIHLVKAEGFITVHGSSDISREVEHGSVGFGDDSVAEIVACQVDGGLMWA